MADGSITDYKQGDVRPVTYSITLPAGVSATVTGTPTFQLEHGSAVVLTPVNVDTWDASATAGGVLEGEVMVDFGQAPGGVPLTPGGSVYLGRFSVVVQRSDLGKTETLQPTVSIPLRRA